MRKHIINTRADDDPIAAMSDRWLDLQNLARVEVTSEEADSPIESALTEAVSVSWRAAQCGEQVIRLIFDEPQPVRRIFVQFDETVLERTQEFLLHWSNDGKNYREIVRQRWNFSPNGSTRELEDYQVDIHDARVIELRITPDVSGGAAPANLTFLRIAA